MKQTSSISHEVVAVEIQTAISSPWSRRKEDNAWTDITQYRKSMLAHSFQTTGTVFWVTEGCILVEFFHKKKLSILFVIIFWPFRSFVVYCVTKARKVKDHPATRQFTAKLYFSVRGEDSEERLASSSPSIPESVPSPLDLTSFGVVRCEASTMQLIRQSVFVDEELKRSFAAREFSNF